ncbi:WD40-repeat-containing domain protein [Mycena olivaceomarginata]|nr:WD40-repeat-containing domain protein [Mycena olivaceomarginata]
MRRNMDDEIERLEGVRNFVLYDSEVADSALHIYQIASFHPAFNEWSNQPGIFGRHRDGVTCLAISPDGRKLASASKDTFVRIWDVEIGHCILETAGHTTPVLSVAFSPDGSQLVSAAEDGSIRVWDVQTGLTLVQFVGHSGAVNSVVYTTDGERVVSGSKDATIRIWSIESGQEEVSLYCQSEVLSLSISPGGTTLVSGSVRGVVQLWDIAQHKCTREVLHLGHISTLSTVFSLDASRIAIGRWDRQVNIWNTSTGVAETTLYHRGCASSVAFSPDGSSVASGCGDGLIRIWKVSSGKLLGELDKHPWTRRLERLCSPPMAGGSSPHRPTRLLGCGVCLTALPVTNFHGGRVLVANSKRTTKWAIQHQCCLWRSPPMSDGWFRVPAVVRLLATSLCGTQSRGSALLSCGPSLSASHRSLSIPSPLVPPSPVDSTTTFISGIHGRGRQQRNSEVIPEGLTAFSLPMMGALSFRHPRTGPSNSGITPARPTLAHSVFLNLPKNSTASRNLSRGGAGRRVHQIGAMPIDSVAPFPNDTQILMCSKGTVEIWDTDHNPTDQRSRLLAPSLWNPELTCTPSDKGDTVYVAAVAMGSARVLWDGKGERVDSNGPQWNHVRAKQYPNIVEESGWVSHTRHAQIGPRKIAWIPKNRRNMCAGALATSQSGRLFAIGSQSGLITILDVSAMVEHLEGPEPK